MPDGIGLSPLVWEVTPGDGTYPKTGCTRGLGQWWTGLGSEVTCPACLELVHA